MLLNGKLIVFGNLHIWYSISGRTSITTASPLFKILEKSWAETFWSLDNISMSTTLNKKIKLPLLHLLLLNLLYHVRLLHKTVHNLVSQLLAHHQYKLCNLLLYL